MTAPPQRAPLLLDLRTRLRLSLAATMAVRQLRVVQETRRAVTLFLLCARGRLFPRCGGCKTCGTRRAMQR
jgi:hypothetical protein